MTLKIIRSKIGILNVRRCKFQVCTPDCDDCSENLNAHYFVFTDTNKFGAKNNYVEYIDCFSVLASKIDSFGYLRLFNLERCVF